MVKKRGLDAWMPSTSSYSVKMVYYGEHEIPVQCPFCLYQGKRHEFYIPKTKSIGHKNKTFECPDCLTEMRYHTLMDTLDMPVSRYVDWVWDNRRRVKWQKIKERLKEAGIATEFWNLYFEKKRDLIESAGIEGIS